MHNNFFFLNQLAAPLRERFIGGKIISCFSQSKDELVLTIIKGDTQHFCADLKSVFSSLYFPEKFARAKKNSVDIFPEVLDREIVGITIPPFERSLVLLLDSGYSLLFKLHGNRSNILLCQNDKVIILFKNSLKNDWNITPQTLGEEALTKERFLKGDGVLETLFPVIGKPALQKLASEGYHARMPTEKWTAFQGMLKALMEPSKYYVNLYNEKVELGLFQRGSLLSSFSNPIEVINDFYFTKKRHDRFSNEKRQKEQAVRQKIKMTESYIKKTASRLEKLSNDLGYKERADVIMANLNAFSPDKKEVTLLNFYTNEYITIKTKHGVSPAKLAQNYYRKGKNQHKEIQHARAALDNKEKELSTFQTLYDKLKIAEDYETIQIIFKENPKDKGKGAQEKKFHEYEYRGYRILVGKNARNNDDLTFNHSFKEDLWLHVKDAKGSHVLIKYVPGKPFSGDVIERAAELAAKNSKRKNEAVVPVMYTPKKYVRKRKGFPVGSVLVEKEKILLVKPL